MLYEYAKKELEIALGPVQSSEDPQDGWNELMRNSVLELVAKFSEQGHSGFSAGMCVSMLEKILRYEPLSPLTGEDSEWFEIDADIMPGENGEITFQNVRCPIVFQKRTPEGVVVRSYDIDGKIFREPNGNCFTSSDSVVDITFPYTPERVYVDVPAFD